MHPWSKILSTCDEIEELLRTAAPGADASKLSLIQFKAATIGGHDSYLTNQANRLASRAAIYFSERRHQTEQSGAEGVMREMRYSLLKGIRERIDTLKNQPE
ncbi:hypothetical protein [Comamonas terrigena]|uniref:hypothetical protein n=1 Tax=Comamonas terrigena TaxID=32013 RepID=UPI00244A2503|nr:hypothetical protein [Comamonas terrigena]MDH1700296.1 hypothetical protein [Comamonas terrigena]